MALTYFLIAINVVVSLIGFTRMNSMTGGRMFMFSPSEVAAGKNYQGMFLSHFSHGDGAHLFFNMMTFYFFGPEVEGGLGAPVMLDLEFGAALGEARCRTDRAGGVANWGATRGIHGPPKAG